MNRIDRYRTRATWTVALACLFAACDGQTPLQVEVTEGVETETAAAKKGSWVIPAAPAFVKAEDTDTGAVALAWRLNHCTRPIPNCQDPRTYELEEIGRRGGSTVGTWADVTNSLQHHQLHRREGTYTYRVRAIAGLFAGPWSDTVAVEREIPTPPELTHLFDYSNNTVVLYWTDESDTEQGFRIEGTSLRGPGWWEIVSVPPNRTWAIIDGSAWSHFRVVAFNGALESAPSDVMEYRR